MKNLLDYLSDSRYTSFVKGVPLSEESLESAKILGEKMFRTSRKNIRIKYRGPRPFGTNHTLKKHASAFDAYFWTR